MAARARTVDKQQPLGRKEITMNMEEQGKKTSPVISDAAVREVVPAMPTATVLSDEDLDNVAGGIVGPGDVNGDGTDPSKKHNYKGVVTLVR